MRIILIYSILCLTVLSLVSCFKMGKSGHDGLSLTDCMKERKNQEVISNQTGKITLIGAFFVIVSQDETSRFLPCNMPESYKKDGTRIQFSLITKEIYPNERHIATPSYLTDLK